MSDPLRPDLCIIGAGAAGLSVAASAAAFGVPTVLVERGEMGGECLHTGCVPSKSLIAAARTAHGPPRPFRDLDGRSTVEPDFKRAIAHVKAVIADIAPTDSQARYTAMGVTVLKGDATFIDRETVQVGEDLIKARRFVVAAGSRPAIPAIAGLDATPYLTNETIFELDERPRRLLIIGAGPVGCELGQAFQRLGSDVTLFDAGPLLPREDPELAGIVGGALARDGVVLHEHTPIAALAFADGRIRIHYTDEKGAPGDMIGTHLLLAPGRAPITDGLGLDAGWIKYDKSGIIVDGQMRTSNRRVYAVGDCVGGSVSGCRFTHAASLQAAMVIREVLFRMRSRFDPALVPRVTFTDPEIAAVGLSEEEARARHSRIRILRFPISETDRARVEAEQEGLVKVIATSNARILGAAICARNAGEMISLWTLALAQGMKLSRVAGLTIPYPTRGEASKRAALEFYAPLARRPMIRRIIGWLRRFG
jgi:pyruvate/2-oxoglutarate dehydrogenase complex dihydrolipoamide dehydrogenase (E3) component